GMEVGCEWTHQAISAHEMDRADRFLGGSAEILCVRFGPALRPQAGQCAYDFTVCKRRFRVATPFRAAAELRRGEVGLAKRGKITPPALLHSVGIFEILRVEGFDEGGVRAEQKRRHL